MLEGKRIVENSDGSILNFDVNSSNLKTDRTASAYGVTSEEQS